MTVGGDRSRFQASKMALIVLVLIARAGASLEGVTVGGDRSVSKQARLR